MLLLNLLNKLLAGVLHAMGFPVQHRICFRPYVLPVVVGLCLGITVHMMFVPFLEDSCDLASLRQAAQMESHLSGSLHSKQGSETHQDEADDFVAKVIQPVPTNITVNRHAARPKVSRPRYISTELGIREKLFVAVLTSANSVDTFGLAIDKTLSKHVTKIIFFSTTKPTVIPNGLPMVAFGDKHSELLPIHVLRYISEHYHDTFDFYMFLSDRAYVRGDKLFDIVEHISIKEDVHMGTPSTDSGTCGLDGVVIVSQSVMAQVFGNLDWCMKNSQPGSASISLGRCIHHASQRTCSNRGGDKTLTYSTLDDFDYDDDIHKLRGEPSFNKSLIFYPIPDDMSHYKLHRYFCYVNLNETQQEIAAAKQDMVDLSKHSPGGPESLTWPLGVAEPYKPTNRYSVVQWTYFTDFQLYLADEMTDAKPVTGADRLDILDIKRTAMENIEKKYPSRFTLRRLANGYRRFDPTRGMEYILDLQLIDKLHGNAETLKRVHLIRPVGQVELVPMPYVTENMMVTIILPLRPENVELFDLYIDSYARVCLQSNEDVRLIIVLLYPAIDKGRSRDLFARPKTLIAEHSKKFNTQGKLSWKVVNAGDYMSDISIVDLLLPEFQTDALVLLSTVNAEFLADISNHYLNRVRMNTIKGKQVFLPMGFWQFKPNLIYNKKPYPASVEIGQRLGQFSMDSFDHCSFYISDYKSARKTLTPTAVRSGDIFMMFIAYEKLHVFRAVEPNLKLRWMNMTCPPTLPGGKYQQCITQRADGLASQHHLALLIYEQRKEVITQPIPDQVAIDAETSNVKVYVPNQLESQDLHGPIFPPNVVQPQQINLPPQK